MAATNGKNKEATAEKRGEQEPTKGLQGKETKAEESVSITRPIGGSELQRRREPLLPGFTRNPFEMLRRMSEDMDRVLEDFGLGRSWMTPTFGRSLLSDYGGLLGRAEREEMTRWIPEVEIVRRDNELVVRADVPGLRKEDLHIEVRDDGIVIDGERRDETEEKREGYHYSERRYGRFHREIPLPEGVKADDAKASFRDGVLEVTMPAPKEEPPKGREISID